MNEFGIQFKIILVASRFYFRGKEIGGGLRSPRCAKAARNANKTTRGLRSWRNKETAYIWDQWACVGYSKCKRIVIYRQSMSQDTNEHRYRYSQLRFDRMIGVEGGGGVGGGTLFVALWTSLKPLGLTWSHLDSLGLSWIRLDSLGLTLRGLTWTRLDSLGFTWTHLDSLGLTRTH